MQPHPTLESHYRSLEAKPQFLRGIFDRTAPHYEAINRWGFFGSGDWYRRQALLRAGLTPGMRVLDVAAGTGPTARAAAGIVGDAGHIVCLDASLGMLRVSQQALGARHVQGVADRLPVRSGSFDFLTMGFALRHVENLENAFREYRRALRPGGKALILDTIKPRSRAAQVFAKVYFHDVLPWCARLITGNAETSTLVKYYWDSMSQMLPPERVCDAMRAAGFQDVAGRVLMGIFSEFEGVNR